MPKNIMQAILAVIKKHKGHLFKQASDKSYWNGHVMFKPKDAELANKALPELQAAGKKHGFKVGKVTKSGGQAQIEITWGDVSASADRKVPMSIARIVAALVERGEEELAEELLSLGAPPPGMSKREASDIREMASELWNALDTAKKISKSPPNGTKEHIKELVVRLEAAGKSMSAFEKRAGLK